MSDQRTVLITGGTGSLGYRTAEAILAEDPDVTVVVSGRRGVEDAALGLGDRAVGRPLDLASLDDVRRFARGFGDLDVPPLHAIVCNAGIQVVSGSVVTADGFEQTFAVNHLAHFLLVRELLPAVAAPGRIVFVASDTHDPTKPTGMPSPRYTTARELARPGESTEKPGPLGRRRYTTSKLCNVLAAYEFARRLDTGATPRITVNAFDPGLMPGTGLGRDYPGIQGLAWRYLLPALTVVPGINVHTARQSARALARLVLDPGLADTTGRYFSGRREIRSSADSYDTGKAADLWDTSVELTESA
ncbi:NAD(P)-dependent dehydrogenase (short-subunit alcohol dehydrogenase family) [Nocardia transvalensis]|uniref:NAD(P)-dependent dehydrogenase (Short-subunit alcohol dehydrogenase family) n=1 Tax=Nocardia transvalensis TaxID=37333 RepID=A0A7W9P957_9NOCA|nr:SDR family NAD(P)-dependent oxidoreductase [Nocardia transvalensis]MBB5911781.1 NAD(P)-dependent dehydrogenase (short-subunit alcohol dehydrogenase family) [Nocardia transvalensis]